MVFLSVKCCVNTEKGRSAESEMPLEVDVVLHFCDLSDFNYQNHQNF